MNKCFEALKHIHSRYVFIQYFQSMTHYNKVQNWIKHFKFSFTHDSAFTNELKKRYFTVYKIGPF